MQLSDEVVTTFPVPVAFLVKASDNDPWGNAELIGECLDLTVCGKGLKVLSIAWRNKEIGGKTVGFVFEGIHATLTVANKHISLRM